MKKIANLFKKIAPWCVAAGIFAYLFHLYPPAKVWHALTYVNLPAFIAFAAAYFIFIFVVDSIVMRWVITHFSHPVSLMDILTGRGATYLIMVLNYPASQAAYAYYLKRRYGIPIFEALGIFLFVIFIDLLWIISLAFAGSFFQEYTIGGIDIGHIARLIGLGAAIFTFVWLAFWRRWPERVLGRHIRIPFIERLRTRGVFSIFNKATAPDYLKVAIMRIPIHFTIIISMYIVLHTFNVDIPFVKILGNIPIVFLIGTLPITPGGLGTTNAATVELLHPYITGAIFGTGKITPQELLFSATLLWMFANYSMKGIVGTFFLKRASSDLFKPTADVPEEEAEEEAAHIGGNI